MYMYFDAFAKNSQELSPIYYLEYCQLIYTCLKLESVFVFYFYYEKCEKNCRYFVTLSKWSIGYKGKTYKYIVGSDKNAWKRLHFFMNCNFVLVNK